jgi:GNAT superfamily N-acetyltransferase
MTTAIRPAGPEDEAFIVSAWSSSQRMTRDIPLVPMDRWAEIWHPVVRAALARRSVRTIVAHGALALFGFLAFEPAYVYYVYVAQPYRRRGIARELFAAAGIDPLSRFEYACRTKTSWELRGKVPSARYDPYRARFAEKDKTP